MQYGGTVPQEKSNSSLEVVSFLWINNSGYNFNIMNIHYMNLQPSKPSTGKNSIFQITISRLPLKANKIYVDIYIK